VADIVRIEVYAFFERENEGYFMFLIFHAGPFFYSPSIKWEEQK